MELSWKFLQDKKTTLPDDNLLGCLIILSKYYKNPCSGEVIAAGLPLTDNKLTPSIFNRAAERAHLDSQMRKRQINDISNLSLPAILLLKDQKACLLVKNENKQAQIIIPEAGKGISTVAITDLEKDYLGYVIFVREKLELTKRSEEILPFETQNHWFWGVFRESLPAMGEILLASFLINVFVITVPLFIRVVYDRVIPHYAFETLWVLTSGVIVIFIFDFLLRTLRAYFIDHASKATDIKLSSIIFSHILGIKMSARPNSIGSFANTLHSFEFFREFITSSTVTLLVDIPFFFMFVIIIFMIGGVLGFIPLIMMPIVLLTSLFLQIPIIELTRKSYAYGAEKQATLYESLSAAETIKTEAAESHMQSRWEKIIGLSANINKKLHFTNNLGVNFSIITQQLTTVLMIIGGVYEVANNNLTVGGLIAISIIVNRALAPINQAAMLLTKYFQARNSLKAINNIMQLPIDRPIDKKPLHHPHFKGNIEFKNVTFAYGNKSTLALKHVSFKIKPGERVAILGRIGSGKTTIAKLILGLYQATEGSVTLDGLDINQLDPVEVRRSMGYVPQDIVLLNGSIKENIILGHPTAEDVEILKSAFIAGITRFTQNHPEGLDRHIGENGKNLSGGQRQTLVLARALLETPDVFLFDEPCNAMDDTSEAYFINQFVREYTNKTLLLVTHKASMLSLVERVIILDQGMIVADGPKEQVIEALKNGKIRAIE